MEADAHFLMGSTHGICQDYALAGFTRLRWAAIVCDGCSSSPDTDLGARVLARAFLATLMQKVSVTKAVDQALEVAHTVAKQLDLPLEALDATLCGWIIEDGVAHGFVHGDGILSVRSSVGLEIHHATQPSNAPDYPNYRCDSERALAHHQKYGADTIVTISGLSPRSFAVQGDYRIELPLEGITGFAAFSDGAATVSNGEETLPVVSVVDSLTRFPQPNGTFFNRRLRRQVRDWAKLGFAPTDDLAGAAIAL
jgi:hypothetical protein